MGLNRADNRNFFDFAMLEQLVTAYGRLANVPDQVVTPSMPAITCPPSHEPRLFRLVNSYASSAEPKLPDSASHRRRESSTCAGHIVLSEASHHATECAGRR